MRRLRGAFARAALVAVCLAAAAAASALAQGRGGGGPPPGGGPGGGGMGGPGGMNPGMGGPPPGNNRMPAGIGPAGAPGSSGRSTQSGEGQMRPVLQLGPPGRWWDDKSFAKSLKLRPEQQARMDAIFEQNRDALLSRYEALQRAESQMEETAHASAIDEAALFAQIDRVTQARADLEKANAHYVLQLRKEIDPDQLERLEKRR